MQIEHFFCYCDVITSQYAISDPDMFDAYFFDLEDMQDCPDDCELGNGD